MLMNKSYATKVTDSYALTQEEKNPTKTQTNTENKTKSDCNFVFLSLRVWYLLNIMFIIITKIRLDMI